MPLFHYFTEKAYCRSVIDFQQHITWLQLGIISNYAKAATYLLFWLWWAAPSGSSLVRVGLATIVHRDQHPVFHRNSWNRIFSAGGGVLAWIDWIMMPPTPHQPTLSLEIPETMKKSPGFVSRSTFPSGTRLASHYQCNVFIFHQYGLPPRRSQIKTIIQNDVVVGGDSWR